MDTIKLYPGALNNVPVRELAAFLAAYNLELVHHADGLYIRRRGK